MVIGDLVLKVKLVLILMVLKAKFDCISDTPNWHFSSLMIKPCSWRQLKRIIIRCCLCSSGFLLATGILSRYTKRKSRSPRTSSMSLWKVWAAFLSPNGRFVDVFWVDWNLMVPPDQIDFAEDDFARQVGREIVELRYRITVVSCDAI